MKRITSFVILAAVLLPLPAHCQDSAITVQGFSLSQSAAADPITIAGPTSAKPGEVVTCQLAGTPAIDLTQALVDQLGWLIGAKQMFAYVAMPGQAIVPLDVEGTIVFGAGGATMRPQVSFPVADPGEYRLLIDWNFGQNQLVEHVIVVEGEHGPDPTPVNPYPSPPEAWRSAVDSILQTHPTPPYAEAAAKQFSLFGKTVLTDSALQTTGDLQRLLAGGSSAGGSFPPIRDAVAALIHEKIGRIDAPLDRTEAAAMLSAIAWAIWEAGHER